MNQTSYIEKYFQDKERYNEFIKIISSIKSNPIVDAILYQVTRYNNNIDKEERLYIATNTNSDYLGKVLHMDFFRDSNWIENEINTLKLSNDSQDDTIRQLSSDYNIFRSNEYALYRKIVNKNNIILDKQIRKMNELEEDLEVKKTKNYNYVTGPSKDFTIDSYVLFDRYKSLEIHTEEELMRGTMMALLR